MDRHRALSTSPETTRALGALGARIRRFANGSPWTSIVGRGLVVVVALFVLAWIGRTATAASASSARLELADAGAPLAASIVQASAAPLPAPSLTAPPAAPASAAAPAHGRASADDPVYVNHAGVEELRRLPGVGPKRAEAIIALRQRMGRFQRVEDLLRVKGIGRATLRKWRPLLRLDAPSSVTLDAGAP